MIHYHNDRIDWEKTIWGYVRTTHPFMTADFKTFLQNRGYMGSLALADKKLRQYRGILFGYGEVYVLVAKGVYDYKEHFWS